MAAKLDELKQRLGAVLEDLQSGAGGDPEAMWLIGSLTSEITGKVKARSWVEFKETMSAATYDKLLEDRMAVIAALECVNLVTWFEEDTPLQRILQSRPDVLVKGGDWAIDKIVGGAEVNAWGGEVHAIPFQFERSTTTMLAKIRAAAR